MPLFKNRWVKGAFFFFIGAIGVYGMVYWDVITRAKESYQQGEKYMDWHLHPEKKKAFLDADFSSKKKELNEALSKKKISESDYKDKLDALAFDRDYALEESSLKYAYQWYKDTYELFSPPESKWVKLAKSKAPQTLELWKQELREQKIPFEDTSFD